MQESPALMKYTLLFSIFSSRSALARLRSASSSALLTSLAPSLIRFSSELGMTVGLFYFVRYEKKFPVHRIYFPLFPTDVSGVTTAICTLVPVVVVPLTLPRRPPRPISPTCFYLLNNIDVPFYPLVLLSPKKIIRRRSL